MYKELIDIIESTTGKRVSDLERKTILRGPDEIDLVHSGLEDTMIGAYREIRDIYVNREGVSNLRTAAFLCAIEKIGVAYEELGIFP